MVAAYSSEKPYVAYCNKCWWSDEFNPLAFGQAYNPQQTFWQQIDGLLKRTPLPNLVYSNSENCEFTNFSVNNKNCYLITASDYNEDCLYSTYIYKSRNCVDCLFINNCENSYQLVDCDQCYGSSYSRQCKLCTNIAECYDCQSCSDCFGCVGLRHKQNYIFNEPYSPAGYQTKVAELKQQPELVKLKFQELLLKYPHQYTNTVNCTNSSGDYLTNCADCPESYDTINSVNCASCCLGFNSKDSLRSIGMTNGELQYESVACVGSYHMITCLLIWPKSSNLEYGLWSRTSQDCFGCVSLRNNRYCILNQQYTEPEYQRLREKIVAELKQTGDYGEFFPITMSPFAYNETAAQDYFPLTDAQIKQQGWQYKEPETIIAAAGENVNTCLTCGRSFKYVTAELAFYQQHQLTPSQHCVNCRHVQRLAQRNPRQLWHRQCMCTQVDHTHASTGSAQVAGRCMTEFKTTYSPDRKELVYCEQCYKSEVY